MPKILCIETSGPVCSVAIYQDIDVCVDFIASDTEFQHAAVLTVLIEKILQENELTPEDISAVALSAGPGSYTGLRIGTSVAKGLCYALDIPLIAISTLKLLAYAYLSENPANDDILICPAIDARRNEVYTAIYDRSLRPMLKPQPLVVTEHSFEQHLNQAPIHFIGSGAEKISKIITHDNIVSIEENYMYAKYLGNLAFTKFEQKNFETIAYFDPFYLKEFHTNAKKQSQ